MSEPDIQIQRDYPQTLVNSQWVKWAAERIAELEQQLAEREAEVAAMREALKWLSDSSRYDKSVTSYARAALLQERGE
mgnify:CR=1 FL=1|jgi:outer membrane protein assembly factor BamD (BamD/ComL family)